MIDNFADDDPIGFAASLREIADKYLFGEVLTGSDRANRITRKHWQQLKPTAVITETELKKRMIASVPFTPESFWAA